ncbi:MAG: dTMP kinase [Alphaproteobacteria bacterium]|nr:dTMP kinase [Alphaproteobacteria bacterium]
MIKHKNLFITFEGCEGSGKSTQSKLLHQWFLDNNIDTVITREPGGTETSEKIRDILLDKSIKLETKSQLLLHFVSRIEHCADLIIPSLNTGRNVICDRFLDSTIAYQHYGHGVDLNLIYKMHQDLLNNITPHITFILDIGLEKHTQRMQKRNRGKDRYESLESSFHHKVIEGFKTIAKTDPKRCHLVDSTQPVEETHNTIIQKTQEYLVK